MKPLNAFLLALLLHSAQPNNIEQGEVEGQEYDEFGQKVVVVIEYTEMEKAAQQAIYPANAMPSEQIQNGGSVLFLFGKHACNV
jgi:hypothetical protein